MENLSFVFRIWPISSLSMSGNSLSEIFTISGYPPILVVRIQASGIDWSILFPLIDLVGCAEVLSSSAFYVYVLFLQIIFLKFLESF